jgi:cobalt/nickel transport system permease protein
VSYLDKYAMTGKLGTISPVIKILYFFLFIIIALFSEKILFLSFLTVALLGLSYWSVQAGFFTLLRMWMVPMGFVLMGCIPMCFSYSDTSGQELFSLGIASVRFSLTVQNVKEALFVMSRSSATISALLFLVLSTSVSQIMFVMRKCKVPEIFVELMIFIYHSIFIMLSVAGNIYTSQKSRLGYTDWSNRRRTFSILISRMFVLSLKKAGTQWNCIESRSPGHSICFLPLPYRSYLQNCAGLVFSAIFLVSLLYITNHMHLA